MANQPPLPHDDDTAPTMAVHAPRQSPTSPAIAAGASGEAALDSGLLAHSNATIALDATVPNNGRAKSGPPASAGKAPDIAAITTRPPVAALLGLGETAGVDLPSTKSPPQQPPHGSSASAASRAFATRYAVHGELARGGMGVILRAFDADVRRDLAMKVMLGDRHDTKSVARFLEEGQVTGQLEHPNIVPVYEIGVDAERRLYFTMKLVRGRSLKEKIRELRADVQARKGDARFPLLSRIDSFRKICDAIAYAHSRGVIHRDLKPENVMVGEFGEVQVMDWGLAKIIGRPETHGDQMVITDRSADGNMRTLDGEVAGTPAYMPPEQARGEIEHIDECSDVYALGAILYELLALTPPFRGSNVLEILSAVANGRLVPPAVRVVQEFGVGARTLADGTTPCPRTFARIQTYRARMKDQCPLYLGCIDEIPSVPAELEAIILKAMAKAPAERYQRVSDLQADMANYLQGREVGAMRYSAWQRVGKWAQRNKGTVASLTLIAVTMMLMVAVKLLVHETIDSERRDRATAMFSAGHDAWRTAATAVPFDPGNPQRYFQAHLPALMDMGNACQCHGDAPTEWRDTVRDALSTVLAHAHTTGDMALIAVLTKSAETWDTPPTTPTPTSASVPASDSASANQ